jgi:aminoglycoside 2'-N-acetyltransferase I
MPMKIAHTSDLRADELEEIRALMAAAFGDEFDEHDWQHALGGMHVLVSESGRLAGHASVVQRRVIAGGRTLRCGYVEAVAVLPEFRRRGLGTALTRVCNRIVRGTWQPGAHHLGALGATDAGAALYRANGWRRWEGPLSALTPEGIVRTPEEEGYVYVLEVDEPLDVTGELTCDWREGDVW